MRTSVPFSVTWRATRAAVNPPPTITTVRLSSLVAIAGAPLAEVRDRLGILRARKRLAAKFHHVARVGCRKAGIADHAPEHLVLVAAVDRIGKARLHEQRIGQLVEPFPQGEPRIGDLPRGEVLQELVSITGRERVEFL